MERQIKLAIIANDMIKNGISAVIMNYCENINLDKFDVTIIAGQPIHPYYEEKCEELGIRKIVLPSRKKNSVVYYKSLFNVLGKEKFDIVHVHGNSATISIELLIAKLHGIKIRIAHSHNTTCNNIRLHDFLYPLFSQVYTDAFACSEKAGEWLFRDNDFYVIRNGFRVEDYKFRKTARERVREQLGLQGKFVMGHVGRFNYQKNHPFLLEVFEQVGKLNIEAYLLLVGTGPDYDKVKDLISEHPYKDRIILYGETNNVQDLYCAMDVFVLPSRYEGLGIVLLEAQISGLPCVVSDVISREVELGGNISFLALTASKEQWAETIVRANGNDRIEFYACYIKEIERYDIRNNVKEIEKLYSTFMTKLL